MKVFIAGTVNQNINPKYLAGIKQIGQYLTSNEHGIICVGAQTGSIGEMYNTFIQNDGRVDIIVPTPYQHEAVGMKANSIVVVDTLFMLQQIALRNTNVTLVLPGGNGTLAELYMITDSKKSKFDNDNVIIYNVNGFYDKIEEMNNFMLKAGVLTEEQYNYFIFCKTPEEVIQNLEEISKNLQK